MDFEGVAEFVGNYRVCDTGFECVEIVCSEFCVRAC